MRKINNYSNGPYFQAISNKFIRNIKLYVNFSGIFLRPRIYQFAETFRKQAYYGFDMLFFDVFYI